MTQFPNRDSLFFFYQINRPPMCTPNDIHICSIYNMLHNKATCRHNFQIALYRRHKIDLLQNILCGIVTADSKD